MCTLDIAGHGVHARMFGSPALDVLALSLDTTREITLDLPMLRYVAKYAGGQLEAYARDHAVAVTGRDGPRV